MFEFVIKRDNKKEKFRKEKIILAIWKAAKYVGGKDYELAENYASEVVERLFDDGIGKEVHIEQIQDMIEKVLIDNGCVRTSKAFILYREKRAHSRNHEALAGSIIEMYKDYIDDKDWEIKENSNMQKSYPGLNNYIREAFTKIYWLHEIYPEKIRNAHESGDIHIHDLGSYATYCCGWDPSHILLKGFGGVTGKIYCKPPTHLRTFLGQIVNAIYTCQGESAGAQAFSNIDVYAAGLIKYEKLTYDEILYTIRSFVFNLNVPTRVNQLPTNEVTH